MSNQRVIGIALGGGGAKGLAHIGVLTALAERGIEPRVVTGTSIGALVGAIYASGHLERLPEIASSISIWKLPKLMSPTLSKSGLFSADSALDFLEPHFGAKHIEELPNRFGAVATDLISGDIRLFSSGSLRTAVRASIAIPGLFTPVKHDGCILVDGGVVEPVPAEAAYSLGATEVIAVDLFGRPPLAEDVNSAAKAPHLFKLLEGTLAVNQRRLTRLRLGQTPPKLTISPDVRSIKVLDFHKANEAIAIGREAALRSLAEFD